MRIAPATRDRLVELAKANGRSVTQEADRLLHQALFTEKLLGGNLRRITQVLVEFAHEGEKFAHEWQIEGDWTENPEAYQYAAARALALLLELAPGPWDGAAWQALANQVGMTAQQKHHERRTRVRQ